MRARIFVVGCPRSGTTLVQAMLASHPDVYSFPESHFFRKVWGRMWPVRRAGVVSPRAATRALANLLAEVDWPHESPTIPRGWPFFSRFGRAFATVVDRSCADRHKGAWVEKSPGHLHCQPEILRSVPPARFVHVVRDGRAVVASFYDLCLRNPKGWIGQVLRGNRQAHRRREESTGRILDAVIARWNGDIALTLARMADPAHRLVVFDDLIAHPELTLRKLCGAGLGLDFDASMLHHTRRADTVVGWRGKYEHMQRPLRPLEVPDDRFETVLSPSQQAHVARALRGGGDVRQLFADQR